MTTEPTQEAAFFSTIRSWGLVRSPRRVLGGVLAGVGDRIGMAPAPARLIFVLIAFFTGGIALLAYALAWALLPDSEGRIVVQDFGRGRPNVGTLVLIVIMTVFGLIFLDHIGPLRDSGFWNRLDGSVALPHLGHLALIAIPLAILGGIVALIVWAVHSSQSADRASHGYARLPDGTIPQAPASPAAMAEQAMVPDAVAEAPAEPATASGTAPSAAQLPPTPPVPPAPPVYTAPPAPPRPRVPGPGKVGYLLALAWLPISIAITIYLAANDKLAVFPVIAAGVIFVAGLGVILLITALRGRKLGFLGFVSVMALIPVFFAIGAAPELREHYAAGDWRTWVGGWDNVDPLPEPIYTPPPAFDPSSQFLDYETVAINGSCYDEAGTTPDVQGTVRLAAVTQDQTVTVASTVTRLIVPEGTSLRVVVAQDPDVPVDADINWPDRGVSCTINYGAADAVQLTNADAPVLTVRLDDAQQFGSMSLWIEED